MEREEHVELQHEPVSPGEQSLSEQLRQWVQAHRQWVIAGLVMLVLGIGVGIYSLQQRSARQEEAATALAHIIAYYDNGDYDRALYGDTTRTVRGSPLLGCSKSFAGTGSTPAAKIAALYAGSAFLMQGDFAKARPYFERATEAEAPLVLVGAYAGLAACREEEGKLQQAASLYERAATIAQPLGLAERYRFFAALCYEKAGVAQKAAQLYRQILLENEFSDFANEAKAGLARLGMDVE